MNGILHLVFAEPGGPVFRQAVASLGSSDRLVLLGDATVAASSPATAGLLVEIPGVVLGVLKRDLEDRGLDHGLTAGAAQMLTETDLIDWIAAHPLVRSWL